MTDQNPRLAQGIIPLEEIPVDDYVKHVQFATAKKYSPEQIETLMQRGINFHQRGDVDGAMEMYREILRHDPENKKVLYFSAIALSQGNNDENKVMLIMQKAMEEMPNVPEAHYNLGILYHRMGKVDEAKQCFLKAVAMLNTLIEAKVSLGGSYLNEGDRVKGRIWLQKAADTISGGIDSIYSRGFARLTLGDYLGGLEDYDKRWRTGTFLAENRRDFGPSARHWNGLPIPGKTLYVHTEQGAGDVIMLSRFIEDVARRSQAKTIVLEVGATLVDLLAQLKGVDYVIASNTPMPEEIGPTNYYLPMMGIMRKCGVLKLEEKRIPHRGGWLRPIATHLVTLPPSPPNTFKIGVSWAGSKSHKNDRYRSIIWQQFRDELITHPALASLNITWYSFQVGDRARDADDGMPANFVDLTPQMPDFADTFHGITQMDLMICVDTATAHLAGAAVDGPPIWMLVPAAPDWRWGLEGTTTPWYAKLLLFRQDAAVDWQTPLTVIRRALRERLGLLND